MSKSPMRPALVGIVLSLALVSLGTAALAQVPTLYLSPQLTIPQLPSQQAVYRLTPRLLTAADAAARAQLLGLQPAALGKLGQGQGGFGASDGLLDYSLDPATQIEWVADHALMSGQAGGLPLVPDEQQCVALAAELLADYPLILGGPNEQLSLEQVNEETEYKLPNLGIKGQEVSADYEVQPLVLKREVVFRKQVDSVPVMGPGALVTVTLGDQGQVVRFMSNWIPAEKTAEMVPVVPAYQAVELLKRDLDNTFKRVAGTQQPVIAISFDKCRYALVTCLTRKGEQLLMPAFQFRGTAMDQEKHVAPFEYFVLAAANRDEILSRLAPLPATEQPQPPLTGGPTAPPGPSFRPPIMLPPVVLPPVQPPTQPPTTTPPVVPKIIPPPTVILLPPAPPVGGSAQTKLWKLEVLGSETTDQYPEVFCQDKRILESQGKGMTLLILSCRLTNLLTQPLTPILSERLCGRTALLDSQGKALPPLDFDAAQELGKLASYAAKTIEGGGHTDFALVFQVPVGTKPSGLLFTLLRYPDDVGSEGKDVQIDLSQ